MKGKTIHLQGDTLTTNLSLGCKISLLRFNKVVEVPTYTEMEYTQHLTSPEWSREETDHLMDLASRFWFSPPFYLIYELMSIVLLVMDLPRLTH